MQKVVGSSPIIRLEMPVGFCSVARLSEITVGTFAFLGHQAVDREAPAI
jgi:hypothetical protein